MYTTIPIDFDVYKKLTSLLTGATDTYDNVLRRVFELPLPDQKSDLAQPSGIPWVSKGVTLPHGTELRANHKGKVYEGTVDNGTLLINGQKFKSLSAAAFSITRTSINGWIFWQRRLPGSNTWQMLDTLRQKGA